jgi:hypothetical protein
LNDNYKTVPTETHETPFLSPACSYGPSVPRTGSRSRCFARTRARCGPTRTDFHIRYINGSNVYIDGGTTSGLREGTELILKQSTNLSEQDPANAAIEPGVIARLEVISVASTSAVCEISAKKPTLLSHN